jgi:hypothetical protein
LNIASCSLVKIHRRFRGEYSLYHLPDNRMLSLSISFHLGLPYSYIIWVTNNRHVGGRSLETRPADMNMNMDKI